MTRRLSLLLTVVLAFAFVSLAVAQQQDQPSATPNPLVQLLQSKGVLTAQEAAAINQAPTPAEQQSRLTQLLYSKGIITQDEYKTTAAEEASRASESRGQGMWIRTAAHASAGDPDPDAAVAAAPQAPPAPSVIPAVAPVRVLTNDPPKAGGMVPDLKLGSGAKLKLYGFVKSSATYDTSNPYNIDFELPGLGGVANGTLPASTSSDVLTGGSSSIITVPGAGNLDSGPNGSPSFYLKASATRLGTNLEWPDFAGSSNTLTGRIEVDFEGNFNRSQNRNVSSIRTRQVSVRLAWARLDHKFSESTTGFALFGMDWTPFGSSTQANLLETTGGAAFFGGMYEREAQFRLGLWHNFGGSRDFKIGIEPAIGMPGFGDPSSDVAEQIGVSERQGSDSGRPEITGRLVFQWQLDKARGVAPAQLIFSGMNAKRVEIINALAIRNAWCGTQPNLNPPGFPSETTSVGVPCAAAIIGSPTTAGSLLASFPRGAENSSQRWGADAEIQLPTRYMTLVGKYYTGADLRYYFAGQVYTAFTDNRIGLLGTNAVNGAGAFIGTPCGVSGGSCPQVFDMDASAPNSFFGFNPRTDRWRLIPQRPTRAQGGFAQIAFPLSRIFNANPAGRNAGWTFALTYGTDQAEAKDVLAQTATGNACVPGVQIPGTAVGNVCPAGGVLNALGQITNTNGSRQRSDMGAGTLVWKFNQYFSFNYESSVYLTRSDCAGTGKTFTSFGTFGCGTLSDGITAGNGTPFRGLPARYWHDWRNEFGPVITF